MNAMRTDTVDYAPRRPGIRDWFGALVSDRARLRRILMYGGVGLVAAIAAAMYLTGGRFVTTDDAYVHAAKLMVSTDVSGLVATVNVKEGQTVKKGDILFTLDRKPFEIALQNAQAALLQTRLDVEGTKAQYHAILGQIASQQAQAVLAGQTLARYSALARSNAIAGTQVDQARSNVASANAMVASLQNQARQVLAQLGGNPDMPVGQSPAYLRAQAAVAEATRQLDHTTVRAPFDGTVTEVDSLQPGTLVISAMSAFSTTSAVGLVSTNDTWIGANMKETDLTYVRQGNPVDIAVDTFPSCKWQGKVDAVAAASDSSFSPLPSENGSGNWVKVVQRIPTRIKITGGSCPTTNLSVGMSSYVSIDTGHRRWSRIMNDWF
jgi:membrane fusion protein (multidrug efflux system)